MSSIPSTFTPPYIKREPRGQNTSPAQAYTPAKKELVVTVSTVKMAPWAVQAVQDEEEAEIVRIEPVHKPKPVPWAEQAVKNEEGDETDRVETTSRTRHRHWPPAATSESAAQRPGRGIPTYEPKEPEPQPPDHPRSSPTARTEPSNGRRVSARNYAAVEHTLERYGLIDMGPITSSQQRSLLIHVRRRCRDPFQVLNTVRPGTLLSAKAVGRNRKGDLRVRFTTPARYYSPGAAVTTLIVGVDESDWRSLMARG
jgi:hypothetical protein